VLFPVLPPVEAAYATAKMPKLTRYRKFVTCRRPIEPVSCPIYRGRHSIGGAAHVRAYIISGASPAPA
jgi:hypothetical protein